MMSIKLRTLLLFPALVASLTAPSRLQLYNSTSSGNGTSRQPASIADVLQVVNAIGGLEVLQEVRGLTYNGGQLYRSGTLSQTYTLESLDQSVATTGSSNISFRFNSSGLSSRIDREYAYDDYWVWEIPSLRPLADMSLVVRDDSEQYACFVNGSNNFLSDFRSTQGYTDELVTNYLIHQAHQYALPWLLQQFLKNDTELEKYQVQQRYSRATYGAIESAELGLTLLFDLATKLPYAVRSLENHVVYGPSTSDLVFTNFQPSEIRNGSSIKLPLRLQTVYNSMYVLEDILLDSITVNPAFPSGFFEGHAPTPDPQNTVQRLTAAQPSSSPEYPLSEIHEWYEAGIWAGPFTEMYNTSSIVVDYPDPTFKNIMKIYVGYNDYNQLLIEHETGFIITDAPPHRSKIIIEWLRQTRPDKKITHVVPTHHHSDHADGFVDYVNDGATLVVPYVARNYYGQAIAQRIITYTAEKPFVFRDNLIDFRSYWSPSSPPHTEDQAFPVVTKANATDSDTFILYEADIVNPGSNAVYYKSLYAWDLLVRCIKIGIPRSALIVSAHVHGSNTTGVSTTQALTEVGDIVGFKYPDLTLADWRTCLDSGCQM
ncbi:hypothetical protein M409DRAFT_51437 [Zasmidium cellare ATCC 36951]|uniref:Metallo-beta-lactamase domain-containing protein n=1 Tax=Zasmidium cellare ATCC 36951 TaxID=1080233 RepID=A0A6A6CW16_ZASCE|nr:uncharacterized protein M409DRAFT_51437 [Zasmidium cellare ATCC 36951]KAF2170390.1 hypothetical protein M409DRAFT_51437 [Zasmidium cellare ATCC 36951]